MELAKDLAIPATALVWGAHLHLLRRPTHLAARRWARGAVLVLAVLLLLHSVTRVASTFTWTSILFLSNDAVSDTLKVGLAIYSGIMCIQWALTAAMIVTGFRQGGPPRVLRLRARRVHRLAVAWTWTIGSLCAFILVFSFIHPSSAKPLDVGAHFVTRGLGFVAAAVGLAVGLSGALRLRGPLKETRPADMIVPP